MTRTALALSLIFGLACGDDTSSPDAGGDAGGTRMDAGPGTDGGSGEDAGSEMDGGTDGGSGSDAGSGVDAGAPTGSRAAHCAAESARLREGSGAVISVSPAGGGMVMAGGRTQTLRQVVSGAAEGSIVELADGTYTFPDAAPGDYSGLYFTTPNVTLRSASGDASAVILDSNYVSHGGQSAVITVAAPGIVLQDFTVQRSVYHLIHFWVDGDDGTVQNVRLIDGGQQFLKSSGADGVIERGIVSCSEFIMTAEGQANVWGYGGASGGTRCYTGGIDTHEAADWQVVDNTFRGIHCDADTPHPQHGEAEMLYTGGLAEHAIHMWDSPMGTSGHTIARNLIIDCARGIGLGLRAEVYGGRIENNMIVSHFPGSGQDDVGIIVERGHGVYIGHNTVLGTHPEAYSSSIEYRWGSSENLTLEANLTSHRLRQRDGAPADLVDNETDLEASDVVDADEGDLHLVACAGAATTNSSDLALDFDHEPRAELTQVGADACD